VVGEVVVIVVVVVVVVVGMCGHEKCCDAGCGEWWVRKMRGSKRTLNISHTVVPIMMTKESFATYVSIYELQQKSLSADLSKLFLARTRSRHWAKTGGPSVPKILLGLRVS